MSASIQNPNGDYLSWLPTEERIRTVTGGPGPLTLVRSCGGACDDPATPYLAVQVLLDGEANLDCDLGRGRFQKHFRAGDFAIVPPDTDIYFDGPGSFQALSLAIPKPHLTKTFAELGLPSIESCDQLFNQAHFDNRIPTLLKLLWQELSSNRDGGDLFIDGLWQSVLAVILELGGLTVPQEDERLGERTLDELRDFVRSSLNRAIRIDEMARLADVSPSRFSQAFKELTRLTPSQYVMQERIARAKELLLKSSLPITEVAMATGFFDQSHLNQHFKRHTGGTPAAYRASRAS